MDIQNLTYLLLLLVYLIIPAILSIKTRVSFVFQLRYIVPAIIFAGAIFVMWDLRFTEMGVWSFNPDYLSGIELLKLPIEEWLSFLVIPISAAYIYEWLKLKFYYFEKAKLFIAVSLVLLVVTSLLAYFYRSNMFSFFTFFLSAIYLGYTVFRNRFKKFFTKFYLAYVVTLLPFLIISAILNSLPAIIYNSSHVIGLAVFGVPVERFAYLYLMLLITITIYEYLNSRRPY